MLEGLSPSWTENVHHSIPMLHRTYASKVSQALDTFFDSIRTQLISINPILVDAVARLQMQVANLKTSLLDVSEAGVDEMEEGARGIHRKVKPLIADTMAPSYLACKSESGTLKSRTLP